MWQEEKMLIVSKILQANLVERGDGTNWLGQKADLIARRIRGAAR
jgi:hypothetical protein